MKQSRLLAALAVFACACSHRNPPAGKKMIVLGVDGMDPRFVEEHWSAMPNLNHLRRSGGFERLATTTPPQSPVAWSTFATGLDPAGHGIYDFVHRNPSTMAPFSSLAESQEPRHTLRLGPWLLPLDKGKIQSFRRGRTFWEILGAAGVPVTLLRMPANYPAGPLNGVALSGMGVPDLTGTFGTFTLYADSAFEPARQAPGGRIEKVDLSANRAVLPIHGPVNSLRKDRRESSLNMTVDVDPGGAAARFTLAGSSFLLRQGEWSSWIAVRFPLIPGLAHASGMIRVYASELHPGFRVYVSPVNVNPADPDLPISSPPSYSADLARELGLFYTQGIREDTAALRENAFTLPEFLAQSRMVFAEDLALLRHSLKNFRDGLLFFYFSSIDQNSHMLWGAHEPELLETYRAVDAAVGEVMREQPDATLIVMSDHGFTSFTRSVNLNTWLLEQGYRTRAYSMGLNALYLNQAGREKNGVVPPGEPTRQLLREISAKLLAARDPVNGAPMIESVDRVAGSNAAPDLEVGFRPGYRMSWGGALGAVETSVVQDNLEAWIGDHCVAAREVPGVLFSNRKMRADGAGLKDLTVTLLQFFGVAPPHEMTGHSVF